MDVDIDFERYLTDDDYFNKIMRRYRYETIVAALDKRAAELGALNVRQDIKADEMDSIADYYEGNGMKQLAADRRAKARMAHAQARHTRKATP